MEDQLDQHIGRRLKARRKALRLTQSDLGSLTGIRFRQIHKYETAENRTSAATLWKLACALQVGVAYFFDGLPAGEALAREMDHQAAA